MLHSFKAPTYSLARGTSSWVPVDALGPRCDYTRTIRGRGRYQMPSDLAARPRRDPFSFFSRVPVTVEPLTVYDGLDRYHPRLNPMLIVLSTWSLDIRCRLGNTCQIRNPWTSDLDHKPVSRRWQRRPQLPHRYSAWMRKASVQFLILTRVIMPLTPGRNTSNVNRHTTPSLTKRVRRKRQEGLQELFMTLKVVLSFENCVLSSGHYSQ